MAHNHTIQRRNLAASDLNISMDPTHKKYPKSTSATTTKPHPDPTAASSTIQNISNHFAKLYTNHKLLASSKGSNGHSQPRIGTHFQAKSMAISNIEDTSNTSLTESTRQHRRNAEMTKESSTTKVKQKDKKSLKKSYEEYDMKKVIVSSKTDELKKLSEKELDFKKNESHEGRESKKSYEMGRPSFSVAVNGGRRNSFCSSQTELADFLNCSGVKIVSVDMPPFMQIHAVDCARKTFDSLEKFTSKTLALTLKKEFDGVYGPAWHCIVGTSFGSFVTHSVGGFLYFLMDHKLYILLFKTTVQRAD